MICAQVYARQRHTAILLSIASSYMRDWGRNSNAVISVVERHGFTSIPSECGCGRRIISPSRRNIGGSESNRERGSTDKPTLLLSCSDTPMQHTMWALWRTEMNGSRRLHPLPVRTVAGVLPES